MSIKRDKSEWMPELEMEKVMKKYSTDTYHTANCVFLCLGTAYR